MDFRVLVPGLAAAISIVAAPAHADPGDMALGNPKAGVTVVEYASPSCPFCAEFNAEVFPKLKAKYVDTGKIRYILRETPIHGAMDEGGFLLARCAGPARYFKVFDALLGGAALFENTNDERSWLRAGIEASGLSPAKTRACLADTAAKAAFKARLTANIKEHPVRGTPTIFINGKQLEADEYSIEVLSKAIDETKPVAAAAAPGPAPVHKATKKKRG